MRSGASAGLDGIAFRSAADSRTRAARVRAAQLDVVLRLSPFAILCGICVVVVVAGVFWHSASKPYLIGLGASVSLLSTVGLVCCWLWHVRPKPIGSPVLHIRLVIFTSALFGLSLTSIPLTLFVGADHYDRLLIACTAAGLIALGITIAVIPWAALTFSGSIIVGSFIALEATGEPYFHLIELLLTFYAFFIVFTIIHLGKVILERVTAQIEVERQNDVISLLLYDVEENCSAWLWEVDPALRLRHPSARLAQVSGRSICQLDGLDLAALLGPGDRSTVGIDSLDGLRRSIESHATFRDCVLPVEIGGETRWWSLTGKPLSDVNGAFAGYRGVGSDVTTAKISEMQVSYLARYDPLTDLPNRVLFHDRLASAKALLQNGGAGFAVLCLDLDGFKFVNDTFGHAIGDQLLAVVGRRLQALMPPHYLASRLSGDEFAVLASGADVPTAASLANDIVESIARPALIDGIKINIQVSIGIAVASDSVEDVMRRADLALYRAKNEGRNDFRFYEADMDAKVAAKRAMAADLRGALERDEFVLHFQPIVAVGTLRTVAFETLLRWHHPVRGMVSPAVFIPIAEETGCIVAIGEWILRQACRVAATWPQDIKVAVNLSPLQLRYSDLQQIVPEALRESGLAAPRLELEVTESVLLEATPPTLETLRSLRQAGVRLSLDDFGTGYSSLSYLRTLPFDKIKIDQSFIRDLPNDNGCLAIIRAVVGLGQSMHMTITAEGVETHEQLACLRREGCDELQGFLFSCAKPAEQVSDMLDIGRTVARAA